MQTTLNGLPIESGASRSAAITDLPADLIKSVEIYKTRTPDQVEGSGAGTINVELRKPTDFPLGFTFNVSAAGRYNNQSQKFNQTYTGIVNYRRETAIGDVGASLNVTVNYNPFLESRATNDLLVNVQPRQVVGPQILPFPTVTPGQVWFDYVRGSRKTRTFNRTLQWRNGPDSITVTGLYATPTFRYAIDSLYLSVANQASSTNTLPSLSNIVLTPGTNRISSLTVSQVTQVGPFQRTRFFDDKNYAVAIKTIHDEDFYKLTSEIALTGGSSDREELTYRNRFVNRPTIDIEFASEKTRFPMMNAVFRNVDLLDPDQYRFFSVFEGKEALKNTNFSTRVDLTLRPRLPLIDRLDFGMRFARRDASRSSGTREIINLSIPLAQLPEGFNMLIPLSEGFKGTGVENNARWLGFDAAKARANYQELRKYVAALGTGAAFVPEQIVFDPASVADSLERSVAAYGTIHYKADLLFPIHGVVGARVTNTIISNDAFQRRTSSQIVNGLTTTVVTLSPVAARGNYLTIEPTATAIIDFTRQLKSRLSYSVGIIRPRIDQTTAYINFNDSGTNASGNAGNPDLQPERTTRFDATLEYYFGKNGLITINPFYWKINGGITNFTSPEIVPGGIEGLLYNISRPYNTGRSYRRGVEMQAKTFFYFLPGILKNFGGDVNYTYVESQRTFNSLPGSPTEPPAVTPIENLPKHLFNATGRFEKRWARCSRQLQLHQCSDRGI